MRFRSVYCYEAGLGLQKIAGRNKNKTSYSTNCPLWVMGQPFPLFNKLNQHCQ